MKRKFRLSLGTILSIILTIIVLFAFWWVFSLLFKDDATSKKVDEMKLKVVKNENNIKENEVTIDDKMIYKNLQYVTINFAGLVNYDINMQKSFSKSISINKQYNYFDEINSYLNADINSFSILNTFDDSKPFSDINAPISIVEMLAKSGFNVGSACGQNILNQGAKGISSIESAMAANNIYAFGINSVKPQMPNFIKQINDVKVAFLQYTQSISNAGLIAINSENSNRYINTFSDSQVKSDIQSAKSHGADIVIVFMHWNNDELSSNDYQRNVMQSIANSGADIIIGSVQLSPQPFEVLTAFDESGNKKNVPSVFSLGSILSSNNDSIENFSSILLSTKISYDIDNKKIYKINFDYIPLCTVNNYPDENSYYLFSPNNSTITDEQVKETAKNSLSFLNKLYANLPEEIEIY